MSFSQSVGFVTVRKDFKDAPSVRFPMQRAQAIRTHRRHSLPDAAACLSGLLQRREPPLGCCEGLSAGGGKSAAAASPAAAAAAAAAAVTWEPL